MNEITSAALYGSINRSVAQKYILSHEFPWEALDEIPEIIEKERDMLGDGYYEYSCGVYIANDVKISPLATVIGPAIIMSGTELRPGAYIRGSVIIGKNAVIGNSSEIKNSIIFDEAEIPHFNYVGDSILGYKSHLGAGAITSNVKGDRKNVTVDLRGNILHTGRRKLGAIISSFVEVGSGSVLNPGAIIGESARIYPLSMVRGYIPPHSIYKSNGEIVNQY